MEKVIDNLKNCVKTKVVSNKEVQISSDATLPNGEKLEIYLLQDVSGKRILTDKKRTMVYMEEFYDLNSEDVKKCIKGILNVYGFTMYQNALVCKLKQNDNVAEKYFDMITCVGQLCNMYVFFDESSN